ncbi:hypothetical protein CRG98_049450, partial [Punica granatum]
MRTLLRCLGLLSPRRCPDIPVSVDKFLQIIYIFETLDVDHREVEELSSLLAQPVVDASHGIEQLCSLPFETGESLVPDRIGCLQVE